MAGAVAVHYRLHEQAIRMSASEIRHYNPDWTAMGAMQPTPHGAECPIQGSANKSWIG
jgi:hypothetical protein